MSLNLNVPRNSVTYLVAEQRFGKRSPANAGQVFYAPELTAPTLVDVTYEGNLTKALINIDSFVWAGLEELTGMANSVLRRIFADIYLENKNATTGLVNEEAMMQDWAEWSAGAVTKAELQEKIEELQDEMQDCLVDPNIAPESLKSVMLALRDKIQPLKAQKAVIEAKAAERVAKRKAREEAQALANA